MAYTLSKITKVYQGKIVLDIDRLHIKKGHMHALVGANGAGKTTLLNILAFLERPTSGDILYASRPVPLLESSLQLIRKEVIMVNQHPVLFSTSVYKNLEFGLKIRRFSKSERKDMIHHALELVDMQHKIHAAAHTLSGGERQRAALARAFVLSPKVILCDEPTANVDLEHRAVIMELLREINTQRQITVVFTTHDKLQAASLAHNTIMLERGRLTHPAYENLFTATLTRSREGHAHCRIQDALEIEIETDQQGTRRIYIDPQRLQLANGPTAKPGVVRLQGEITQIASEREKIRIQIQSAISVTLLISKEHYRQHCPLVGQQATCDLTSEAIRVL